MGTDIHMIAEIRKDGIWQTILDKIFIDREGTKFEEETCVPYSNRNYNLFGILADVRNGSGFAGCRTGEKFNPISKPKSYPKDMDERSKYFLGDEWGHHSASYLTLKEIFDFDWTQLHRIYGIVDEEEYKNTIMKGKHPTFWGGGIGGGNCVTLPETEMVDLIQGLIPHEEGKYYYTGCYFAPEPYSYYAKDFLVNMEKLKRYVSKSGTLEDVRIIFDFDS